MSSLFTELCLLLQSMKTISPKYCLTILVIACLFASCESPKPYYPSMKKWRFSLGDNMAWAAKDWNDSQWATQPPDTNAVLWIRTKVKIPATEDSLEPRGLLVSILASGEVYWDGVLIGKNGRVGKNATEEIPGLQTKIFAIPLHLATGGTHQVALRISNFHLKKSQIRYYLIAVGNYWSMARSSIIFTALIHIYAGLFLVVGIYYWFLFFINKGKKVYFLFGAICWVFFALLIAEYIKFYIVYYYHWHFLRIQLIYGLTTIAALLLPLFFNYQFNLGYARHIVLILLPLFSLSMFLYGYDYKSAVVMLLGIFSALLLVLKAFYEDKKGSSYALWGIAPLLFYMFYRDLILFVGFGNLIVFTLISLTIQIREQRQQHQASLLRSSRLEIELLKKNIQPHFLMNSLTSAIDWIEENPRDGVNLLNALVKEFDILLAISDKKVIPITQEIALCQSHLEIMSFRKEITYVLETHGIDRQATIPPALLHTAIENGISHNELDQATILFRIHYLKTPQFTRYTIFNESDHVASTLSSSLVEGTGFKYMKARLEESYSGRWSLQSQAVTGGWETIIEFKE